MTKKSELSAFIERLKRIFHSKLQQKTGWGKDQVYALFLEALGEALLEELGF